MRQLGLMCAIPLGCLCCAAASAQTQTYPNKPIRIISTGGADIVPRLLGQKLTASMGQQIIVEERTGAGTTIGADYVARSAPDGYTLLKAVASTMIAPNFYKISYHTARDFAPVTHPMSQFVAGRKPLAFARRIFFNGDDGFVIETQKERLTTREVFVANGCAAILSDGLNMNVFGFSDTKFAEQQRGSFVLKA